MNAMVQTVQRAIQREETAAAPRLNPNFSYLRVTVGGRVSFLALGAVDGHPQGPIEVYYSALREVVRLQNGRIAGVVGLTTEWRNVSLVDVPAWSAAAGAQQPVHWVRIRDVMPGYRYGVRDELVLNVITPPTKSALQGVDPQSLTWFEERVQPEARAGYAARLLAGFPGEEMLPPARYAVALRDRQETVVYGEQCLAPDLCFTWQRWTAKNP